MIKKILCSLVVTLLTIGASFAADTSYVAPHYDVSLREAHIGNEEIDMKLLKSYTAPPKWVIDFYSEARLHLAENAEARFTDEAILSAAKKNKMTLIGGPLLGNLTENSVTLWLRPATSDKIKIQVTRTDNKKVKKFSLSKVQAGAEQRIVLNDLESNTKYAYEVFMKHRKIAEGGFVTAPKVNDKTVFRVAFGSCFHKIGLHNPNLIQQILKREPQAMMLLGDIAVDDRVNKSNFHRSDYLLRDMSTPWQQLAANAPLYASWDDHDYYNNDRGGIYGKYTEADREAIREVWHENWNNPQNAGEGINFNTRIGPVELIMLDTRSCRENDKKGQYGSYLGEKQQKWLLETLKSSTAPFKIISSGTMWSDYITPGKDSWGTWDTLGREEIYQLIEAEKIGGVLLISGDRHGARGFTIPRPSGHRFYEFEAASLGGVPGPPAMAEDRSQQLFGYHGTDVIAFGEFTFDTSSEEPIVTFRLIDQHGKILEEHLIHYKQLMPAESAPKQEGKHLFILSGQSNMVGLNPEESFTPAITSKFGANNIIVVKDASGGKPIRRWYRDWKPLEGDDPKAQPDLYDSLMTKVKAATQDEQIATVTFVWMQGERDAKEAHAAVYERSLSGLYKQLSNDLGRKDLNFVIGRISDFDMSNEKYPHWTQIRDIQVKVAKSNNRFDWIDTDDLNDGLNRRGQVIKNDLHMSAEGYVIMGSRFAEKAIQLIKIHNTYSL